MEREHILDNDQNPVGVNYLQKSNSSNPSDDSEHDKPYTWDLQEMDIDKQKQGKDIIAFIEQQKQKDGMLNDTAAYESRELFDKIKKSNFLLDTEDKGILIRDSSTNETEPYVFKSEYLKTHTNLCIQQTAITLDGIIERGWDNKFHIITKLDELDRKIYVECTNWEEHIGAVAGGASMWAPEGGIVTETGERQSPALGLFHELAEVYFEIFDPIGMMAEEPSPTSMNYIEEIEKWEKKWYDIARKDDPENIKKWTPSDRWIIEEVEPLAEQAVRNSHTYLEKYKAKDPFSLDGATQSEIKLINKIKNALKKADDIKK